MITFNRDRLTDIPAEKTDAEIALDFITGAFIARGQLPSLEHMAFYNVRRALLQGYEPDPLERQWLIGLLIGWCPPAGANEVYSQMLDCLLSAPD